jgi:single-strand DNA-binding protein
VRNNNYEKDGQTIYGLSFTCEEIDFLDSKARSAERRSRHEFVDEMNAAEATKQRPDATSPSTSRR